MKTNKKKKKNKWQKELIRFWNEFEMNSNNLLIKS